MKFSMEKEQTITRFSDCTRSSKGINSGDAIGKDGTVSKRYEQKIKEENKNGRRKKSCKRSKSSTGSIEDGADAWAFGGDRKAMGIGECPSHPLKHGGKDGIGEQFNESFELQIG